MCDFVQAVGAVADLVIQPYGALVAGSLAGCLATAGYKVVGGWLGERLGVHDTCGVHNLHGMPGLLSGLLSVITALLASQETYGSELFLLFPAAAPQDGSHLLKELQEIEADLQPGQGRSLVTQAALPPTLPRQFSRTRGVLCGVVGQALLQLAALGLTLGLALVTGGLTGLFLSSHKLFPPIPAASRFDDELWWEMAEDDCAGYPEKVQ